MNLRVVRACGTFHARFTRDGEARQRDGQPYFLINELDDDLVEVMFEDETWMLATHGDLELAPDAR